MFCQKNPKIDKATFLFHIEKAASAKDLTEIFLAITDAESHEKLMEQAQLFHEQCNWLDKDAFLREKVHQFEEHATKEELEEVDKNAHNAEHKKK